MSRRNGNGHNGHELTRHHMIPRSRGGNGLAWGVKMVRAKEHEAWHVLFNNRLPEEVIQMVMDHWTPRGRFSRIIIERPGKPDIVLHPE